MSLKHVLRLRFHCRLCFDGNSYLSASLQNRIGYLKTLPRTLSTRASENTNVDFSSESDNDAKIKAKIVFNTHLYKVDPDQIFIRRKLREAREKTQMNKDIAEMGYAPVRAVSLKYLDQHISSNNEDNTADKVEPLKEETVNFPFADEQSLSQPVKKHLPRKIRIANLSALNSDKFQREKIQEAVDKKWMSDYEQFKETDVEVWQRLYGTSQKDAPVSQIPCGGCGAHFQCKEPSIPGYLPSELMVDLPPDSLKGMVCQRCHFLKNYQIALDVRVPPAEYPSVLDTISTKLGLIVLIIDLLDFPCSIWPGISALIGVKKPVIIVGNKVDLIPGDRLGYLSYVKTSLKKCVEKYGLGSVKIRDIMLISARTGFGVEELITELQKMHEYKGDVYLLGCTNVGKSTLFNCLLQSDLCKVRAVNLVQRATVSPWPNTTLNLLKFPMLRPSGYKVIERQQRLKAESNFVSLERRLRTQQLTKCKHMYHMPSIMQFVGRTFRSPKKSNAKSPDMFNFEVKKIDAEPKIGLDEDDYSFRHGRWCYDTPGVSHPDQILTLLTTDELLEVLPSSSLVPRTFCLRLGQSLFIGGLARIDFTEGDDTLILTTVFASPNLPITIVWTTQAEEVYTYCIGSKVLGVPHDGEVRLSHWPGLSPADESFTMCGKTRNKSCADIVLSSTGWISITTEPEKKATILGWTPEARGVHLRLPALLPYAVRFKGARVQSTPMYGTKKASPNDQVQIIDDEDEEE